MFFFSFLFLNGWLCWVFAAVWNFLSLRRIGAPLQLQCTGLSVAELGLQAWGLWQLQYLGSVVVAPRHQSTGSVVVAQGLSCSMMYRIFPDQGSNPCLLHWQWILYHKSAGKTLRNSYVSHLLGFKIITIVIKTPLPLTYKVYDVTYLSFPNYNPHPFIQNRISFSCLYICLSNTNRGRLFEAHFEI